MASTERRTQAERREGTRTALLEATIAALVELGYTRATTTEVVRRAGLSQGALFKHFPTKGDLVAAATARLFDDLIEDFERAFQAAAARDDVAAVAIRRLWQVFCAPELLAVYRLYVEAPFDEELMAALVPVVKRHEQRVAERAFALFPEIGARPEVFAIFTSMLFAMQGMALARPVNPNPSKERVVLAQFETIARQIFSCKTPGAAHA
jgi:AcrR family transcriptional regulator